RLEPDESGTRLYLLHEFDDPAARDQHVQGWRFQLSLFSNVVADEVHAGAASLVDAWFDAWTIFDDRAREDAFGRVAAGTVSFRDRFSMLDGLSELVAHSGAAQRFMPGVRLRRAGSVRHCQGRVLADWTASGSDGVERMSGTSMLVM